MTKRLLTVLLLAAGAAAAHADTLLLDGVEMAQPSAASRPARGMNMDRVARDFGEPSARHSAVGEPPITRWDYPGFSVYFEHNLVLHSVVRR